MTQENGCNVLEWLKKSIYTIMQKPTKIDGRAFMVLDVVVTLFVTNIYYRILISNCSEGLFAQKVQKCAFQLGESIIII